MDKAPISNPLESSASDSGSSNTSELESGSDTLFDCETPKDNMFDPFAPAFEESALPPFSSLVLEKFAFAPMKKVPKEFKVDTCRKLDFDSCVYPTEERMEFSIDDDDDLVLEYLCKSITNLIIGNEIRVLFDGYATPTSVPRLTGIADRCPDAPLRSGPKSRLPESDWSMCRKLDFESC